MKKISLVILAVGIILTVIQIRTVIIANYRYENAYTQYWSLADKSSTIPAKQKYIAQFVAALEAGYAKQDFASHDAKWLQTPNNSFQANLDALKSLAGRLEEIQKMNPTSFVYNTAIQQITAQEQGEAKNMMGVFDGCYTLANYPMVWDWIGLIFGIVEGILILVGGIMVLEAYD
jgi:hypothetical protein